jgi:hypothetical protein
MLCLQKLVPQSGSRIAHASIGLLRQSRHNGQAVSGQFPTHRENGTAHNLCAVYCVIGNISLSVVRFIGSCFVVHGFVGWRVAVYTLLLDVAVDTATSAFDVAVAVYTVLVNCQFNYFIMEPTFSSATSVIIVNLVLAARI